MLSKSLLFIPLVVFIDQFSKYFISIAIPYGNIIPILPIFNLTYTINTGIAFSLFRGANIWFIFISFLFIGGFIWLYMRFFDYVSSPARSALMLVVGGACGNLTDRIVHGGVVDFLDFYIGNSHFPAFNVADSVISIGGIILFILIILGKERSY